MLESTDALLALALDNDLPLSLSIDATQWWQFREDLWNWYDKSRPTYNDANRYNVEWYDWDPVNATSISWRNWGSQFRMPSPAPNFASPAFREAAAAAMGPIAARVAAWYVSLPPSKKYLLAYVRCTQELWQGTNYFYYPGANALNGTVSWPPSDDPHSGVAGSAQIGYAALCSRSCPCAGPITVARIDTAISSFVEFAAGVLSDAGIPRFVAAYLKHRVVNTSYIYSCPIRSRIMSHTGTFFANPPTDAVVFNSPAAAVTSSAAPGWSLYNSEAINVGGNAGLAAVLAAIDGTPWGAPGNEVELLKGYTSQRHSPVPEFRVQSLSRGTSSNSCSVERSFRRCFFFCKLPPTRTAELGEWTWVVWLQKVMPLTSPNRRTQNSIFPSDPAGQQGVVGEKWDV